MKLQNKDLKGLSKYFLMLGKMLLPGVNLGISWLTGDDLGFTYRKGKSATIHIAAQHSMYEGLNKSDTSMMILGTFTHEVMHQILTNFNLFKKMSQAMPAEKRQLFATLFNIFEDSRIEIFAPSYVANAPLIALEFTIEQIWSQSPDINPEDPVFFQVLNALIQYGDMALVKGEMSEEAEELFDEVLPLFHEAMDARSCAKCLIKAQEAVELLFPYMPEDYRDTTDKSDCDSEGEDSDEADDSGVDGTGKSRAKRGRRGSSSSTGKGEKDKSEEKSKGKGKDKDKDKGSGSGSDKSDKKDGSGAGESDASSPAGGHGTGDGGSAPVGDDSPIEEIDEELDEASEADIEEARRALEEAIADGIAEAEKEEATEVSDYDFSELEHPAHDKWVKTISHHKAYSGSASEYEGYLNVVKDTAHSVAKLIKRRFKNKSGGTEWADHGDLNLMRYKDPNFRSPLIFDDEKPNQKHSAAVFLLVDESGSMGGNRIKNARFAAIALAEAMAEARVPCMIVGHSGDSKYDTSVELEHYTTWKNLKSDRESLIYIKARCQNRDGPAIRWADEQLKKRKERRRLLIVISDGAPCADGYHSSEAVFDTKSAIREAKRNHDVIGLVIEPGSARDTLHTMYGDDYVECDDSRYLKDALLKIIEKESRKW